jgi:hypothetical protein
MPGNREKRRPWTLVLRYPFDPKANAFAQAVTSSSHENSNGSSYSSGSSFAGPRETSAGNKDAVQDVGDDIDGVPEATDKKKVVTLRAMAFGRRREADKSAPHVANRYIIMLIIEESMRIQLQLQSNPCACLLS